MHGRAGQGVSIVVDVVPTQDKSAGALGEGLGGISGREAGHLWQTHRSYSPFSPIYASSKA
jgi:hypothetical protein